MKAYILWPLAVLAGPFVFLLLTVGEWIGLTPKHAILSLTVFAFVLAIAGGIVFEKKRKADR